MAAQPKTNKEGVTWAFLLRTAYMRSSAQTNQYADLSDEDKERWDELEWDEDGNVPDEITSEELNKYLGMLETMRRRIRSLVKLIEKTKRGVVYTDFEAEISRAKANSRGLGLFLRSFTGLDRGSVRAVPSLGQFADPGLGVGVPFGQMQGEVAPSDRSPCALSCMAMRNPSALFSAHT